MSLPLEGLAPPQSLRLDRPVWGVDPSTAVMAFAGLLPGTRDDRYADVGPRIAVESVRLPGPGEPIHRRWRLSCSLLCTAVTRLTQEWGVPGLVLVEQPFSTGHKTEPTSYYAIGALLIALGDLRLQETDVEMVPPQSWKKAATGLGRLVSNVGSKRDQWKAEKRRLVEWAQRAGYAGSDSNEADAVGLATAAGVLLEQRRAG